MPRSPTPDSDRHPARPGERALPHDPGLCADATLAFIGRLRTPWRAGACPKNIAAARETARATGRGAWLELEPAYRPGLQGLAPGMALVVLYWLGEARRDLIVQAPRHRDGPAGVFALRSPVRPNPIGLATVLCTRLDADAGVVEVDALDAFDGTPLLDIKPWIGRVDSPPQGG